MVIRCEIQTTGKAFEIGAPPALAAQLAGGWWAANGKPPLGIVYKAVGPGEVMVLREVAAELYGMALPDLPPPQVPAPVAAPVAAPASPPAAPVQEEGA